MMKEVSSLAKAGFILGLKAGLGLSVIYLLAFVLLVFASTVPRLDGLGDLITGGAMLLFFTFLVGGVIGILPATFLGGITGWLLGWALERRGESLTRGQFALMSMGICFVIALFVNVVLVMAGWTQAEGAADFFSGYLLLLGVPSLIYVAVGAWVGMRLYRRRAAPGVEPQADS
jgi:hypothetical protein